MAKNNLAHKTGPEPRPQPTPVSPGGGRVHEMDRLIHEHVRLAIVSALAVNDSLTFSELKRLLDTTDGNLSIHARKLEEGGYLSCEKYFEARVPKTVYRLTKEGREALNKYLDHMEALIKATRSGSAG